MMRSRVAFWVPVMAPCIPTSEYTQSRLRPSVRIIPEATMSEPILLDVRGEIALITLNRPERLNALSYEVIDRLMAALDAIEVDANVRVVILTGAGERAFSAGADIHEFSESVSRGA